MNHRSIPINKEEEAMEISGPTPTLFEPYGEPREDWRITKMETPNWENYENDECLDDIYHVLKYMAGGRDRIGAIQQRSKDTRTTWQTVFDACTRRLYGVGNGGIARFEKEVRLGTIVEAIRRQFSLSPRDVPHFRRILSRTA